MISWFEFRVLVVLLYVRIASLFYMGRIGPDQFSALCDSCVERRTQATDKHLIGNWQAPITE
jgi:hypothetical protein